MKPKLNDKVFIKSKIKNSIMLIDSIDNDNDRVHFKNNKNELKVNLSRLSRKDIRGCKWQYISIN